MENCKITPSRFEKQKFTRNFTILSEKFSCKHDMKLLLLLTTGLIGLSRAYSAGPYSEWGGGNINGLEVDLGYEKYRGETIEYGYHTWKGYVRFVLEVLILRLLCSV